MISGQWTVVSESRLAVVRGFPGLKGETWETRCTIYSIGVDKDGAPVLALVDEIRKTRAGLRVDEER